MSTAGPPNVNFPRVSQILESRRDLVLLIRESFLEEVAAGPILLVSGRTKTNAYAEIYKTLFEEVWRGVTVEHRSLEQAPSLVEAEEVASKIYSRKPRPSLIVYIGGQTIGDSAKLIVRLIREKLREEQKEPPVGLIFGGIITSLSNDGIFSVTSSLRDKDGLPTSVKQEAPDFVVGHKLTLLRQPYPMKISCVGDILAKISSLWDYNYSCRVLEKYHNDFAVDLAKSASELPADKNMTRAYLQSAGSIDVLFRAVQLCGLSMQLAASSETCSGSEHVGQKWLDEYILRYNKKDGIAERLPNLTHGAAVTPMTITTLYMQGQAEKAEEVKKIAGRIDLPYKVKDLKIPGKALQICLALGLGYRCPKYLTHVLHGRQLPKGEKDERLTILEEIEFRVLPDAVRTAMMDAGVADETDFGKLPAYHRLVMEEVLDKSLHHTFTEIEKVSTPDIAKDIRLQLEKFFKAIINE